MTFENGTFYRVEESPEASPFELSTYNPQILPTTLSKPCILIDFEDRD